MNYLVTSPCVVILAGGQSKRLGSPKQLLQVEGTTLLERTIAVAQELGDGPVVVVLGAHAELILPEVRQAGIEVILNPDWQEGMAASLRAGIRHVEARHPQIDGILFLVCDQPFLQADLLKELINLQARADLPLAACRYGDRLGTPALFHQSVFSLLLDLKGDTGARKLLEGMAEQVAILDFEKGVYDIDTREDYERLLTYKNIL
jgi:molybdenum cofactor cytidylyltransferase